MNNDLVNYIKEGVRRGFSVGLLKQKLLEVGFNEKDVEEAAQFVGQSSAKTQVISSQASRPMTANISGGEMIHGELGIFKKMGKTLTHPTELFDKTKEESIGRSLVYLLVVSLIPFFVMTILLSLLLIYFINLASSIFSTVNTFSENTLALVGLAAGVSFATWYVVGIVGSFIVGAVTHLFAKIYRGAGTYGDSYRALVYGSTPNLLYWFISPLGIVWSFILMVIGLSENHGISRGRAFLILLSMIIFFGLIGGLVWLGLRVF